MGGVGWDRGASGIATIHVGRAGVKTDYWTGNRAPQASGQAAPLLFRDTPLPASWSAELRLWGPTPPVPGMGGGDANNQCGLVVFSKASTNLPPYTTLNPNSNNHILQLALQPVALGGPWVVALTTPGGLAWTSPREATPYFSLRLDFDHLLGVFTAWYRVSTTHPWHLLVTGVSDTALGPGIALRASRVGVFFKSWMGAPAACSVDFFSLRAMSNSPLRPFTPATPLGVTPTPLSPLPPPSTTIYTIVPGALAMGGWGAAAAANSSSADGGLQLSAPTTFSLPLPLLPGTAFTLGLVLTNASSSSAGVAAGGSVSLWGGDAPTLESAPLGAGFTGVGTTVPAGPAAGTLGMAPFFTPPVPPSCTIPGTSATGVLAGAGLGDAALLRLHLDFTNLPHTNPPGGGSISATFPPAAATPWFQDCASPPHPMRTWTLAGSPGGSSYAWLYFSGWDTRWAGGGSTWTPRLSVHPCRGGSQAGVPRTSWTPMRQLGTFGWW